MTDDKDRDITTAMIGSGSCRCGQLFLIIQPEHKTLAKMLSKMARLSPGGMDIFIADQPEAHCSKCGQAISLPVSEVLDTDRSEFGRWIEKMRAGDQASSTSEDDTQDKE